MARSNFKIFSYFLITVFLTLGLSISFQSLLAAWTAPLSNPPICAAGNPGCDEPVNKGANLQIKGGPLYVNANNLAATGFVAYGNVGIGTINPEARLHIAANTTNAGDNTAKFSDAAIGPHHSHIHYGTSGDWYIRSAAAIGKVILQDTGGYVGIGTVNPNSKLTVAGTVESTSGGFKFPDATTQTTAFLGYANPSFSGTVSATAGSFNNLAVINETLNIGGTNPRITFTSPGPSAVIDASNAGGNLSLQGATVIRLLTSNGAGQAVERITVMGGNGYVGIGTTEPQYALDVVGNSKFSGSLSVPDPTQPGHAATKSYVDSVASKWTVDADGIYRSGHVGIGANSYNAERAALRVRGGVFIEEGEEQTIWGNPALEVNGTLTASVKNFRINYPGKPGYDLVHSSLEGPEIGVYYRGQGKLSNGQATIKLPVYFEKLTRQEGRTALLTAKGSIPYLLSAGEVKNGEFIVFGTVSDGEFYWEVKAVRADQARLEAEIPSDFR